MSHGTLIWSSLIGIFKLITLLSAFYFFQNLTLLVSDFLYFQIASFDCFSEFYKMHLSVFIFLLFCTPLPHCLLEDSMRSVGDSLVHFIVRLWDSQGQHLTIWVCLFGATSQSPFNAGMSGLWKGILWPNEQIHVLMQPVDLSVCSITSLLTNEQLCGFDFLEMFAMTHCSCFLLINLFLSARISLLFYR